jgi:hypothetical protein
MELLIEIELDDFNIPKLKQLLSKSGICLDAHIEIDKWENGHWRNDITHCYLVENSIESYDFFCFKLLDGKLIDVTSCIEDGRISAIERQLVKKYIESL